VRDPRFDVLFEPVQIGPKVARNRFYQVPHCNGLGHRDPHALAAMRGMKAAGGWAVVCTEEVEVHPASEVSPSIEGRLWSDADIPAHALVADAIHEHGALAGIELVFSGPRPNYVSRMPPMGVRAQPVLSDALDPVWCRAMDKSDIADARRWHANAAKRARQAGYDLVYCYAGHGLAMAQHFLSRAHNDRTDEYGGALENRVRFLRELIEDARGAIGPDLALAVRIAVEEGDLDGGLERAEIEDVIGLLDPLVDLWDFCLGSWPADSQTSRFAPEGFQDDFVRGLKSFSQKPVVGVGRFTSPETMLAQVRSRSLDFIGAARPSIADPFLPAKIEAGQFDDIRECIGCNICVAADVQAVPIRCTQNPSMGEEWRRGWHPERLAPKASQHRILVVGAGPAGLEAALGLGRRGYEVALAEATRTLGGRARREARLPGLSAYARVADWREGQIGKLANIAVFRESPMTADDVLAFGAAHVVIASGASWRRDGRGHAHPHALTIDGGAALYTPDDVMAGATPSGDIVVYDDDHGVIGSAVAEQIAHSGARVTLITPAPLVSAWTQVTLEQAAIEKRLLDRGVRLLTRCTAVRIARGEIVYQDAIARRTHALECAGVVLVTGRTPERGLLDALDAQVSAWPDHGLTRASAIGDALSPAMIAHAVFAGRAYAEAFDAPKDPDTPGFKTTPVV